MSRDDESPSSIFVRFKQHVDSNVASGFNTMLGLPSPPSRPQSSPSPSPPTNTTPPNASPTTGSSCPRNAPASPATSSAPWDAVLLGLSPYSPRALRHLPQPVPNDLTPSLEGSAPIFTFEDAFEDLLIASRGQPLPDITTRYDQRKLLRQMYPSGEPAWFWLQRLRAQGLVDAPNQSALSSSLEPDWSRFRQELESRAADVWRDVAGQTDDDLSAADFFHELGRTFKRIEETIGGNGQSQKDAGGEADHDNQSVTRREPDHFDDLFSIAESAFAEPQKTWDTFMKVITEHHNQSLEQPTQERQSAKELKQPQEPSLEKKENKVVTRDEHIDWFGYVHSKVTVKTLDDYGNEIGSETSYSLRPADKQESADKEDSSVRVNASGKAGWFWK